MALTGLRHLKQKLGVRVAELRAKAGNGMPRDEYQRVVGRIRELSVLLEEDIPEAIAVDLREEA
jgi:hypothetical protein